MSMWKERETRIETCTSVSTLVNETTLEKQRYYVKSIMEAIQFLAVNEIALRGNYNVEERTESVFFVNLFEYTLKIDKTLSECLTHIPENASYTSPHMQNDIIEVMAETVREKIAKDIMDADVPWFTLLEDGTTDKNDRENVTIAIRYVKNGSVKESLLHIVTTEELDAKSFTDLTMNVMQENGLDSSCLLSQCFDGASVMSGRKGGVAARIRETLKRNVPYIHCYNHRLHFEVVKTMSEIPEERQFFDQCAVFHNLFQQSKIASLYEGRTIVRLLEQHWSGHLPIIQVILSNYEAVLRVLNAIGREDCNVEDKVESIGLKTVMKSLQFRFLLVFNKKILGLLELADNALHSRTTSLSNAIVIIKCVKQEINEFRKEEYFSSMLKEAEDLLPETLPSLTVQNKRSRRTTENTDYLYYSPLPPHSISTSDCESQQLQKIFNDTIDLVMVQLDERFSENEELLLAIESAEELKIENLQPLENLGVTVPSKEEVSVVKAYLSSKHDQNKMDILYKNREVFKKTYELLATVATFGCSAATCESTFSTLTAINRPQRLSVTDQRLANLVFLAFEKQQTQALDFDEVLQKFSRKQNCRLQLF